MEDNLECWEDLSLCFWIVPVGIFFSLIFLGCFCGYFITWCLSDVDLDAEPDETTEDSTIK